MNKPPFSLGRVQMAWWFFLVVGSFLFIFARIRDFIHIINGQALILMGISAGTGISAVFIDEEKSSSSSTEVRDINNKINVLKKEPVSKEEEATKVQLI